MTESRESAAAVATRELTAYEMSKHGTILIVDDDPSLRFIVRTLLTKVGFSVLEAENGAIGVEIASQHQPDLVVTDWDMPVLGGRGTIQQLRAHEKTRTIPIVVLTMRSEPNFFVHALEAGAQDFVTKPLQRDEFVARGSNSSCVGGGSCRKRREPRTSWKRGNRERPPCPGAQAGSRSHRSRRFSGRG